MREIYFGDFRIIVIEQIKELKAQEPESHTTEWFLLKYLTRIEKNAIPPTTPGKMENSVRAMVRFYVDNVDERSALGERCKLIYEQYRKTILESQRESN